jgi:hypothetical protein
MQVEAMFERNLFHEPEWDLFRVQLSFIDHFVRGLVTTAGLKEWEKISGKLFEID